MAKAAVTMNAFRFKTFLISDTARIEIPVTTIRLKEADPISTIGPSAFGTDSMLVTVLKKERKISGAAEPSASSATLATLEFQTGTPILMLFPSRSFTSTCSVLEVILEMASMRMSEATATPRKT